jgi:hypothetical protein
MLHLEYVPVDTPETPDTKGKIGHNGRWRRVERARKRLDASADKIMSALIDKAKAGDVKAAKFLLEHTETANEQGELIRPLAPGVDRPVANAQGTGDTGPRIFIGVSLGQDFARLNTNQTDRPALPPAVVSHPVSRDK